MGEIKQIKKIRVDKLIPYVNNAKIHSENQVAKLASSIREFGFVNPVLVDKDYNVIAGHGRILAAQKLCMEEIPCVFIEGLSEAQRKAYILADNRLSELADWDMDLVTSELEILQEQSFDFDITGFDLENVTADWFSNRERNDNSRQEGNDEYNEFLDKFETKKTTDDCYTPQNIYDVIAEWVAKEYKLDSKKFFRPFYPDGNYQNENYEGKIVVDNPPFSILSEIEQWYNEHEVKYFLFAPNVTTFASKRKCCSVCVGVGITYENGACVMTSFVTNLEDGLAARTAPDLYKLVDAANKENTKGKEFPVYEYPPNVVTAAMLSYLSKYGQDLRLAQKDVSEKINGLDEQKKVDKGIFGGGFLISEKAAAEKAAAEKAAAEKAAAEKAAAEKAAAEKAAATVWQLSDRELEIVKKLGHE